MSGAGPAAVPEIARALVDAGDDHRAPASPVTSAV